MSTWKDFEIECNDYLNEKYGELASFTHQGGSDSTIPDIFVETNNGDTFYIEVKHSPAQSGQFVLLPDIEVSKFVYSSQNASQKNSYAEAIMAYMNSDFDAFRGAGTSGKDIDMDESIFADWIIDHYSDLGVEFIISNEYVIIPISELSNCFDITARYRIKRSGTSSVGRARINPLREYLDVSEYAINEYKPDNDKLFVYSSSDLNNVHFIVDGSEYMFSRRDEKYEIRKLSNTYNANVIFSITLDITPDRISQLREQFEARLK